MHACVEGPSFAGKSTLGRRLSALYDGVFIGEYMDYATIDGRLQRPPVPTTVDEAKAGVDFFMGIERERSADIRRHQQAGQQVFSDRSVVSLAAYQLALKRHGNELPGEQIAVPDYAITVLQRAIDQGDVALPESLIILSVASREVHEARVQRRGHTSMGAFNHWFFSQALSEATHEAADQLLPPETLVGDIISHDGEAGLKRTIHEAVAFLSTPRQDRGRYTEGANLWQV